MSERLEAERRIRALIEEAESLRAVVGEAPGEMGIIGRSPGIRGVCNSIRQVAPTDATVLILGETGTGKELVPAPSTMRARAAAKRLVRENCAAIPESLIESEFLGHEKGAFTGATARRDGRFAQADGAHCSWTRSASSRSICRPSCFACCRKVSSNRWERREHGRWTCVSSPRPTAAWRTKFPTDASVRTCIIA